METSVLRACESHLRSIAKIHEQSFGDHFLGQYPVFIIERFYRYFLSDLFFVALQEGKVSGFVLGGSSKNLQSTRKKFVRENVPSLLWATFISPKLWREAIRRFIAMFSTRSSKHSQSQTTLLEEETAICILSIAVSPELRGTGTAMDLLNFFENSLPHTLTSYWLAVKSENLRAVSFYKKMGFEVFKEEEGLLYLRKYLL